MTKKFHLTNLQSNSKTACRGFKSFCPCHDDGLKNGLFKPFLRLFFSLFAFAKAVNASKTLGLGFIWGLRLPNIAVNYQEIMRLFAFTYSQFFTFITQKTAVTIGSGLFVLFSLRWAFSFALKKYLRSSQLRRHRLIGSRERTPFPLWRYWNVRAAWIP